MENTDTEDLELAEDFDLVSEECENAQTDLLIKKKKKVNSNTPTKLTLRYLKSVGIPARVVEKYIKTPKGGFRIDCFGSDIIGLTANSTIGIQAGAATDHQKKIRHALDMSDAGAGKDVAQWLASPHRSFHVWTWSLRIVKNPVSGTRRKKPKWVPRVTEIYMDGTEMKSRVFILTSPKAE